MVTELRRKLYDSLLEWKLRDHGTSAAFVDGARRVGKSTICERFAQREYRSYLLVDFAHLPGGVRDIFEQDSGDLDVFFLKLSAVYGKTLYQRESVVIFDEVQLYEPARQLIKYLVADGRYDYIETGSLVTLKKHEGKRDTLIPSEEEHLKMYPLDFEEFLWAKGDEATMPALWTFFRRQMPLGQALHRRVMNDFRTYMLVGGMPQAVCEFVRSGDLEQVDRIKRRIVNLYREDVSKFAKGYEARVFAIFDQIPSQLSKREKKFKLADLGRSARFRSYKDAFVWLDETMVVNTCLNAEDPGGALAMSADHSTLKCYMGDTGLLVTLAFWDQAYHDNDLYRAILLDRMNVNEGMLAENVVAQTLRAAGHQLFFYSRSDSRTRANTMEIDFLVPRGRKICPVEVKPGRYQRHASLDKFTVRFGKRLGQSYILYGKDVMEKDGIIHLPLYMAMFL